MTVKTYQQQQPLKKSAVTLWTVSSVLVTKVAETEALTHETEARHRRYKFYPVKPRWSVGTPGGQRREPEIEATSTGFSSVGDSDKC